MRVSRTIAWSINAGTKINSSLLSSWTNLIQFPAHEQWAMTVSDFSDAYELARARADMTRYIRARARSLVRTTPRWLAAQHRWVIRQGVAGCMYTYRETRSCLHLHSRGRACVCYLSTAYHMLRLGARGASQPGARAIRIRGISPLGSVSYAITSEQFTRSARAPSISRIITVGVENQCWHRIQSNWTANERDCSLKPRAKGRQRGNSDTSKRLVLLIESFKLVCNHAQTRRMAEMYTYTLDSRIVESFIHRREKISKKIVRLIA